MIDVITANIEDSGTLNLNIVEQNDLSSSWVLEKPSEVNQRDITNFEVQLVTILVILSIEHVRKPV